MKTISNSTPAFVSGAIRTKRLQIAANGKAFKELISGIYSDKPYAIARELIANAWDAQVQGGNGHRPFDLHLPTVFDPTFSIRDYGISMTDDLVMDLYQTLFMSTKDDPDNPDSNKYVGKFGLGSKSPFAYTDAFQLTTYLDGVQRVYDIYFNGGDPLISQFLECPTDEETGVLITFPVEADDVDEFARAAARAMEPLDLLPNLTGRKVEVPERTILFQGKGWRLQDATFSDTAEAKQGTVLYPLRYASIPKCPIEFKPLIEAPLRIDFEIGQLDVITSREALSYDDVTAANIVNRLKEIVTEIRVKVEADLASHTTYFAWCKAYFAMRAAFPAKVWSIIENNPPKFKNTYPPTKRIDVRIADAQVKRVVVQPDGTSKTHIDTKARFAGLEFCTIGGADSSRSIYDTFYGFKSVVSHVRVETSAKIVLVLQDKSKRLTYAHERMKVTINRLGRGNVYLWVKHPEDAKFALNRLYAYLGRPEFVETVNLADVEVPAQVKLENIRDTYKVWSRGSWDTPSGELTAADVYYVITRRGDPESKAMKSIGSATLVNLFSEMRKTGAVASDAVFIAVPVSAKSAFFAAYEAVDIEPFLIDFVKTRYNRERIALQEVETEDRYDYKHRTNILRASPPWIYRKFKNISEELSLSMRSFGKATTKYSKKASSAEFEDMIAGTCIEDAYILWLMKRDAGVGFILSDNATINIIFGGDKKLIAEEKKEIAKLKSQYQHQFNLAGGKVLKEFPILCIFNNYNVNESTKKFIWQSIKKQIDA